MGRDGAAHPKRWKPCGADCSLGLCNARDMRDDDPRRAAVQAPRDPLRLVRRNADETRDVVSESGAGELMQPYDASVTVRGAVPDLSSRLT